MRLGYVFKTFILQNKMARKKLFIDVERLIQDDTILHQFNVNFRYSNKFMQTFI